MRHAKMDQSGALYSHLENQRSLKDETLENVTAARNLVNLLGEIFIF